MIIVTTPPLNLLIEQEGLTVLPQKTYILKLHSNDDCISDIFWRLCYIIVIRRSVNSVVPFNVVYSENKSKHSFNHKRFIHYLATVG